MINQRRVDAFRVHILSSPGSKLECDDGCSSAAKSIRFTLDEKPRRDALARAPPSTEPISLPTSSLGVPQGAFVVSVDRAGAVGVTEVGCGVTIRPAFDTAEGRRSVSALVLPVRLTTA
jgi:hypothetical protein